MNQCDLEETKLLAMAKLREAVQHPEEWEYSVLWRDRVAWWKGSFSINKSSTGSTTSFSAYMANVRIGEGEAVQLLYEELEASSKKLQDAWDCTALLEALSPKPPVEENASCYSKVGEVATTQAPLSLWQRFRHQMWLRYG